MRSKFALCILLLTAIVSAQQWQIAQPAYRFKFPRDYFSHPQYQTEWWYYTGNLETQQGRKFGFELTFFRTALQLPAEAQTLSPVWNANQIYLAHVALSDMSSREFYHQERINRAGPALAGASLEERRCWNGNWQVLWQALPQPMQHLQAVTDQLALEINLVPVKPVTINGENGVSAKGPQPQQASHYFSFTRLRASGTLHWHNQSFTVAGLSWSDHEFFSEPPDATLAGWDWFSIQLNDGSELMLYRVRRSSQDGDRYSSGTYVDAQGAAHFINASQFNLISAAKWKSATGAIYPMNWHIEVPSLALTLDESTALDKQEMVSRSGNTPSYWEGAVRYTGTHAGRTVTGVGYLEMTGYGHPVWLGAVHK